MKVNRKALLLAISKVKAYHGSNIPIKKFSRKFSAMGGVTWFCEDKDQIIKGESGATGNKYIMEVELTVHKTAGWDLYEQLGLSQIESMGYDSIKLDDDWIIFNPKNIKVVKIEEKK